MIATIAMIVVGVVLFAQIVVLCILASGPRSKHPRKVW